MKQRKIISYSVIRFRPYPELGEFVNVGIVALCHETCKFDYILTATHRARVNNFFQELDKEYFKKVIRSTAESLKLLKKSHLDGAELFKNDATQLFQKFTAPVESVLYYEQPSAKIIDTSFEKAVENLYNSLVLRQEKQSKVYQEVKMAKKLKETFKHNLNLQNIVYDECLGERRGIHLNLTCTNQSKKHSIRVLDLNKREPNQIIHSGSKITEKIDILKEFVEFDNVLLTIHPPKKNTNSSINKAYQHVMKKFDKESKIDHCNFMEKKNIIEYATLNLA